MEPNPDYDDDETNEKMKKIINDYLGSLDTEKQQSLIVKPLNISERKDSLIINTIRHTVNSQRIPNENRKKEEYIKSILQCLKDLLDRRDKQIRTHEFEHDAVGFYILSKGDEAYDKFKKLMANPEDNGNIIGSIPKVLISFGKITPDDRGDLTAKHNTKIRECKKIMDLDRLHVGWVNGEKDGLKLLGTIAMLYGLLTLISNNFNIMFGKLDDDSDKGAHKKFGFEHKNPTNPFEASADFTNFEQIIGQVTYSICREYPDSCNCFQDAIDKFKPQKRKLEKMTGGKRRRITKRRKSKRKSNRRKTKRRRKY